MNRAAGRLGLRDTSYANPIGLDEPGNYSSPRDLATLTLRLRRRARSSGGSSTPRGRRCTPAPIRARSSTTTTWCSRVPWINGVKTGYTLDAGYVLVGSGTRKGVTLLSVVMGAPSEAARDQDTLSLLRYGFSLYLRRTPVQERGDAGGAARCADATRRCRWSPARSVRVDRPARPVRSGGGRRSARGRGPDPARPPARDRRRHLGRRGGGTRPAAQQARGARARRARRSASRVDDAVPGPASRRLGGCRSRGASRS